MTRNVGSLCHQKHKHMTRLNKIALVTGGSRGLGKDMALNLGKKGIDVIITYHSRQDEATKVVAALTEAGVKSDSLRFDAGDVKRFPVLRPEHARKNTGHWVRQFGSEQVQ